MISLILDPKLRLVSDQPPCRSIDLVTDQVAQCLSSANITTSLGITTEDGPDGSIDAAEIERIARKKILLEG
ncbi:MAG: hypothetical protein ACHRXM_05615 [Isosphaerales bacterium]